MRDIGISVKTSLNLPSAREMRADIEKLRSQEQRCRLAIGDLEDQIQTQKKEQKSLANLAENPIDSDGIAYNPAACRAGAARCEKHISGLLSTIKREREKIAQLTYMIGEIEGRICQSETMSP